MKTVKKIFSGSGGGLSSKRVIGAIIGGVMLWLAIDAHFSERVLNEKMFDVGMYVSALMIVGGVAEKWFGKSNDTVTYEQSNDKEII